MFIIVEIDGLVFDVAAAWHRAHREAAASVGWSAMDRPAFWGLTRKNGREAKVLRGVKPLKLKKYYEIFAAGLETDEVIGEFEPREDIDRILGSLAAKATLSLVTLGSNVQARKAAIEHVGLARFVSRIEGLSNDPRKRPGELRFLSGADERTIVAAAGDTLVRSAGEAGIVTVAIPRGACTADRLHRAGAGVVYDDMECFRSAVVEGSEELTRAGLLPPGLG